MTRLTMRTLLCVALGALSTVGCGGGSTATEDSGAKFSEIYPLLFPAGTAAKCNFCHSMNASNVSNGKLSMGMDKDAAYAALVGKSSVSAMCEGAELVVPGQPEMSLLYQKVSGTPPCGSRMPLGAGALPDNQVEMIRSWIAAGAKND
jgi:hypothetical protein